MEKKKKKFRFFPVKDMHCRLVLTFLLSPIEWQTFCQNWSTCYYIPWKKLNFHVFSSPFFWALPSFGSVAKWCQQQGWEFQIWNLHWKYFPAGGENLLFICFHEDLASQFNRFRSWILVFYLTAVENPHWFSADKRFVRPTTQGPHNREVFFKRCSFLFTVQIGTAVYYCQSDTK